MSAENECLAIIRTEFTGRLCRLKPGHKGRHRHKLDLCWEEIGDDNCHRNFMHEGPHAPIADDQES